MTLETNLKPRLLWCQYCKKDFINDKPDAKCEICGETLLTVLFSIIDGSRITGAKS